MTACLLFAASLSRGTAALSVQFYPGHNESYSDNKPPGSRRQYYSADNQHSGTDGELADRHKVICP